jgi:primosomal protein N' (replication factor Y)
MLQCHHCETRQSIPDNCPQCQSRKLATRGIGTEKTEQLLQQRFNGFPVIRIDRDSTRNRNQLDALLSKIQEGEPCLLVGTQMLAKGHHFPKVTLVAVLDADNGLFSPDFRGQESMVQLLFQVAGRSGREDLPGQVIIQTRHATHIALQSLIQNNYNEIAERILAERELANMPPYSFLTLFKAEATDIGSPLNFLNKVSQLCEEARHKADLSSIKIHRPIPAPMEKRAGRYRAHLLIQAQSRSELQLLLRQVCPALESLKSARKTRWSVDVDPQDLI